MIESTRIFNQNLINIVNSVITSGFELYVLENGWTRQINKLKLHTAYCGCSVIQ